MVSVEPYSSITRAPQSRARRACSAGGSGAPPRKSVSSARSRAGSRPPARASAPSTTGSSGSAASTRAPVRMASSRARGKGTSQLMLPAGTATPPPDCAISWTRCAGAAMNGKRFRMTRPGAKASGCAARIARAERSRSPAVSHTEFDAPVVPDDSP